MVSSDSQLFVLISECGGGIEWGMHCVVPVMSNQHQDLSSKWIGTNHCWVSSGRS